MLNHHGINLFGKTITIGFILLFCLDNPKAYAQIQSITTVQDISFGAFTQGSSGGTITISNNGSRSATGSVVPLNFGNLFHQAVFEIEAVEGTIISILNGPDVNLTGTMGGSMTMQLGVSSPLSPFIFNLPPPNKMQINIGGTLTVGPEATSPSGNYTGSFYITFNNE